MALYEYDVAQVCLKGHLVNAATQRNPEASSPFCNTCGAPTITLCRNCNKPIRGIQYGVEQSADINAPPSFCSSCGKPFPWGK